MIDENAALDALENGKIGGLGLDAYEEEPPKNSPLFLFDNVLLTPHSGAHTKEAADKMAAMAVQNLKDVLEKIHILKKLSGDSILWEFLIVHS